MISYSENLLGAHDPKIVCMDQTGCKLLFPYSELQRFLPPKLLELYERVKQRKDIEMAGLENLEECPHCEFKIVIDNPDERLFRCQNADCEAVTCRKCKKPVSIATSLCSCNSFGIRTIYRKVVKVNPKLHLAESISPFVYQKCSRKRNSMLGM